MEKKAIIIAAAVAAPLLVGGVLLSQSSKPVDSASSASQETASASDSNLKAGGLSSEPVLLPSLEKKEGEPQKAQQDPATGAGLPPKITLEEARAQARKRVELLDNMTPEQWQAQQDQRLEIRRKWESMNEKDRKEMIERMRKAVMEQREKAQQKKAAGGDNPTPVRRLPDLEPQKAN